MEKGQTSIDLMLALVAAIVFFSILNTHVNNISAQVDESSAKNSLKAILLDTYAAAGQVRAGELKITYTPPAYKIPKATLANCTITFDKNTKSISVSSSATAQSYTGIDISYLKLDGDSVSMQKSFPCTSTFAIEVT